NWQRFKESEVKAAIMEETNAPLVLDDIDIGAPGSHEVRVQTSAVGLCHSDLHMIEGLHPMPLPSVLGHEVSGVVESVGDQVKDLAPGDHVVGSLSVYCGHCPLCASGHQVLC